MYYQSKIDKLVYSKINEHFQAERILCNIGWISLKNPGIKYRPEYLNAFSFPTENDEIDYISQFAREANLDIVRRFYRQTNGMRLLCGKFHVPGVLFSRPDFTEHDFYCVALDFSNHGGFSMPKFSPESGLLIGESKRRLKGREIRVHDILTKSGRIVGGVFDESSAVTDSFSTVCDWLSNRIDVAARDLKLQISNLYN